MKLLITGATGFLGWRSTVLLSERGHEVLATARPGGAERPHAGGLEVERVDAGDPAIGELIAGCDAVLHFAGMPDPARARQDPARAVRENAGTTLNLLERCRDAGAGLVYPSTVRAAASPPPDPYAYSKRLGELACELHEARATALRLTSVFGPGQVAAEGATGAIAAFAARALAGEPIVIPGDPRRSRDFVYVDDVVETIERVVLDSAWGRVLTVASGESTPLLRAAELVHEAVGSSVPIETPGGELPPGEDDSYAPEPDTSPIYSRPRALEEGISAYVEWLGRHPAAQGSA